MGDLWVLHVYLHDTGGGGAVYYNDLLLTSLCLGTATVAARDLPGYMNKNP